MEIQVFSLQNTGQKCFQCILMKRAKTEYEFPYLSSGIFVCFWVWTASSSTQKKAGCRKIIYSSLLCNRNCFSWIFNTSDERRNMAKNLILRFYKFCFSLFTLVLIQMGQNGKNPKMDVVCKYLHCGNLHFTRIISTTPAP